MECKELARNFCQKTFVDKGMVADICIHNPSRQQKNIHAHIMLTMRPFNKDGTWGDKQKKEYVLDKDGNKIYDKRNGNTSANPLPQPTGTARTKLRNGVRLGLTFLTLILDKIILLRELTTVLMKGRVLRKFLQSTWAYLLPRWNAKALIPRKEISIVRYDKTIVCFHSSRKNCRAYCMVKGKRKYSP